MAMMLTMPALGEEKRTHYSFTNVFGRSKSATSGQRLIGNSSQRRMECERKIDGDNTPITKQQKKKADGQRTNRNLRARTEKFISNSRMNDPHEKGRAERR